MNQPLESTPRIIVVMGVCGCGKTSFGEALAARIGAAFIEGDRLHPDANVAKMSRGEALQDADRLPWLRAVAAEAGRQAKSARQVVVACSALKKAYRDLLREAGAGVGFIHLAGSKQLALERVGGRSDHFMPANLVDSQYATLESTSGEADVIELDFAVAIDNNLSRLDSLFPAASINNEVSPN